MSLKEIKCTQCSSIDRVPRGWREGLCHNCMEMSMTQKIVLCQGCKKEIKIILRIGFKRFHGVCHRKYCKDCAYENKLERSKNKYYEYITKPEIQKICMACGDKFITTVNRKQTCSPECSVIYRGQCSKVLNYNKYHNQVYTGTPYNIITPLMHMNYEKYKPQKSLK